MRRWAASPQVFRRRLLNARREDMCESDLQCSSSGVPLEERSAPP